MLIESNKKLGNSVEHNICLLFKHYGYWVHLFQYGVNGQPCDIIALKNDVSWLIDAKRCQSKSFTFSRIEPNQRMCFTYAKKCGVKKLGFIIYFTIDESYRWLSFDKVLQTQKDSIRMEELPLMEEVIV